MDLFTPTVDPDRFHANFKSVLHPAMTAERAELSRWSAGFPDRDGKFVKEFQTTFNSSFWEIYLFALFRSYGFELDWTHAAPDFHVKGENIDFTVEATSANAAFDKASEWEKFAPIGADVLKQEFGRLNKEAMIRLSNSLIGKIRAYAEKYSKFDHVQRKPYVIAVAPFEQPDFQYQYDRAIRALLYDYYVDEDAYRKSPEKYPNGPPGVQLGTVRKDNGVDVPLGIFCNDQWREVSAVLFSCVATWGKVDAMAKDSMIPAVIFSSWGGVPNGTPQRRSAPRGVYAETLEDGLQVFHNPYAAYPLDPNTFRRPGVVQHYRDTATGDWVHEEVDRCLHFRMPISVRLHDGELSTGSIEAPFGASHDR